jgi:hypothetical protein
VKRGIQPYSTAAPTAVRRAGSAWRCCCDSPTSRQGCTHSRVSDLLRGVRYVCLTVRLVSRMASADCFSLVILAVIFLVFLLQNNVKNANPASRQWTARRRCCTSSSRSCRRRRRGSSSCPRWGAVQLLNSSVDPQLESAWFQPLNLKPVD